MITDKAKHKARVLTFWARHGLDAAMEAFNLKPRILYLWKRQLKEGNGQLESLNEQSKRPHTVRHRLWPFEVREEIRRLRTEHPNLGKEKIEVLLTPFCHVRHLRLPSVSTIGNLIRDRGGLRTFPVKVRHDGAMVPRTRTPKPRKPKDFNAEYPGHCGAFDTIEKIIHGNRRYVITFTDLYSRISFAWATRSHASLAAKEFFELVTFLFPFPFTFILTDNGSEFMKEFDAELRRLHLIHWHTYPKTPKMNAHAERFNRTLQEEYLDYHTGGLLDPSQFNLGLMKHLLWHNTERPHFALNLKAPIHFLTSTQPEQCKMYLTNTLSCLFSLICYSELTLTTLYAASKEIINS